jgi:hypothetical protein
VPKHQLSTVVAGHIAVFTQAHFLYCCFLSTVFFVKQKESSGGTMEERTGGNFAEGRAAADAKRAERYVPPSFCDSAFLFLYLDSRTEMLCALKRLPKKSVLQKKKRRPGREKRRATIFRRSSSPVGIVIQPVPTYSDFLPHLILISFQTDFVISNGWRQEEEEEEARG